jgi:hypothetical protein
MPDDLELQYTGPLLARLATVEIVGFGINFQLSQAQQTSWEWLEITLHHAASMFSKNVLMPLEFRMFPLPSYFGYLRTHKKRHHALRCAKNSRLAFHALLGLVNLFYGGVQRLHLMASIPLRNPPPSPSKILVDSGLHHSHVHDIITTLQPEILRQCVGVILDPRDTKWGRLVPNLMCINAPLWVIIGTDEGPFENLEDPFRDMLPQREERLQVQALINMAISVDISHLTNATPDSMHRWDALLDRRRARRQDFDKHASDSIKAHVKDRLQKAQNFLLPIKRDGTRFFMWYRSRQGRFRGEIDFEAVRIEFEMRNKGQLLYDEIDNEWDICTIFEPEMEPVDNDPMDLQDLPLTTSYPDIKAVSLLPGHNTIGREIFIHRDIHSEDVVFFATLKDVLYSRYGLISHPQSALEPVCQSIPDAQLVNLDAVRKYVMERHLTVDKAHEFAIRYFVSCLICDIDVPSVMWDLHPDNLQELVLSSQHFSWRLSRDQTCQGYIASPRDQKYNRPWSLIIPNPISVTQCIRELWGPSLEDVILALFERGIDFKVVLTAPIVIVPRPRTVFESNLHPHGWEPDQYEYLQYERRRNEFLRLSHVRVVIARGGILWRLCKFALVNNIQDGPSKDVQDFNCYPSGQHLFEDLIEDEINMLCGVYLVSTGG